MLASPRCDECATLCIALQCRLRLYDVQPRCLETLEKHGHVQIQLRKDVEIFWYRYPRKHCFCVIGGQKA